MADGGGRGLGEFVLIFVCIRYAFATIFYLYFLSNIDMFILPVVRLAVREIRWML